MDRTATTRRSDANQKRQAETQLRDLFNTYACTENPAVREIINKNVIAAKTAPRQEIQKNPGASVTVWTDGSYNAKANAGGVGIRIDNGARAMTFGRRVRAESSIDAEAYALAIGISVLLDTFPDAKVATIKYDCTALPVCAANVDAYADKGAPYTNLRSAFKRARRSGLSILFEHTKGHARDKNHNICDAVARHYSGIRVTPEEYAVIRPFVTIKTERRGSNVPNS